MKISSMLFIIFLLGKADHIEKCSESTGMNSVLFLFNSLFKIFHAHIIDSLFAIAIFFVYFIDLNVGEILWQVANGMGSPTMRNHSALAGVDLPPLGNGWDQVLVTKTLLISAQRTPNEGGSYPLVARDKLTGDTIAELALPAQPIGPPVTYLNNGQQQIAVTISGTPPELLVVGLP